MSHNPVKTVEFHKEAPALRAYFYQIPLSLPVIFSSSAAAVARPGSRLRRSELRTSPRIRSVLSSPAYRLNECGKIGTRRKSSAIVDLIHAELGGSSYQSW